MVAGTNQVDLFSFLLSSKYESKIEWEREKKNWFDGRIWRPTTKRGRRVELMTKEVWEDGCTSPFLLLVMEEEGWQAEREKSDNNWSSSPSFLSSCQIDHRGKKYPFHLSTRFRESRHLNITVNTESSTVTIKVTIFYVIPLSLSSSFCHSHCFPFRSVSNSCWKGRTVMVRRRGRDCRYEHIWSDERRRCNCNFWMNQLNNVLQGREINYNPVTLSCVLLPEEQEKGFYETDDATRQKEEAARNIHIISSSLSMIFITTILSISWQTLFLLRPLSLHLFPMSSNR